MNLTEQLLSRREIYHGRIIDVQVDTVSLPNGNTSTREVVRHPGGVGILALDDEDCAVLVEQYRYVFGRTLLEIPAGKREPGEDPLTTARRELREETGAEAIDRNYTAETLKAVIDSSGRLLTIEYRLSYDYGQEIDGETVKTITQYSNATLERSNDDSIVLPE